MAIYQGSTLIRRVVDGHVVPGRRPSLDVERQDQQRGVRQARHLSGPGHREERLRHDLADPEHEDPGPLSGMPAPLHFSPMTTPSGIGAGAGSSCRPTTRRRTSARCRRRSWRPCRPRPCSSSTTARPTAPGRLADGLAAADPRVRVRHRPAKQGLGRAYLDGFGVALAGGAETVVQMDADFSHDPAVLPALIAPVMRRRRRPRHRLALHARAAASSTGARPAASSRAAAASSPGRVLGLPPHDLTGGFKAWRATTLRRDPVRRHPRRRLRLPDRDDVPGRPRRGADRRRSRSRSAIAASASRKM